MLCASEEVFTTGSLSILPSDNKSNIYFRDYKFFISFTTKTLWQFCII